MTLGFTAVALPYMLEPNQKLHVDADQASWIASLAAIATPIGCLLSGPIIDKLGRRNGLLLVNLPAVVGWALLALTPSLYRVYIGRLLTGLAVGLSSIPATVYISEGATASLRGLLAAGTSVAISAGVAIVYLLGLIFKERWELVAGICGAFPVVSSLLVFWLVPESPVWYMSKGRYEEASASLKVFRGTDSQTRVQEELDAMAERARVCRSKSVTLLASVKSLAAPEAYKPLILMNIFFLFQQLTGVFVVIFYAVDVVKEAGVSTDPFLVAFLIGMIRLVFTVLAAWMSKRFGRRPCALLSGIGITVSLILLGTHLYHSSTPHYDHTFEHPLEAGMNTTSETGIDLVNGTLAAPHAGSPLPLVALLVYILTSTIGFLTLPWTMIGEVYPAQVRGIAGGLTTCLTYVMSFVVVKLYPAMLEALDKHGVFFFYGGMGLLGTIFVALCLPETQGKTLAEIEDYFRGTSKLKLSNVKLISYFSQCTVL
ncbi:hypothetical protein AAG570_003407 [Ranatra chinensis]|uniref:Major facilitator superfamily (MFS) profile domain-containing protein n=1 Tax=Ranatra chinensis TaxID=642074 RepID=A0ABD0Y5S9_9HEMI